jgi:hypothetical protein
MEDEGFVDDDFIAETARDFVVRYGETAAVMLRERARLATAAGAPLLAQAWSDMAAAADALLAVD